MNIGSLVRLFDTNRLVFHIFRQNKVFIWFSIAKENRSMKVLCYKNSMLIQSIFQWVLKAFSPRLSIPLIFSVRFWSVPVFVILLFVLYIWNFEATTLTKIMFLEGIFISSEPYIEYSVINIYFYLFQSSLWSIFVFSPKWNIFFEGSWLNKLSFEFNL